ARVHADTHWAERSCAPHPPPAFPTSQRGLTPPRRRRCAGSSLAGPGPTADHVLSALFRPWRQARTWRSLVHLLLDLPIGVLTFTVVLTLLVTSVSLLIVFPLALPFVWLL